MMRIAGTALEPRRHSMTGDRECDGLKSAWIGKSAGKPPDRRNLQRSSRKGVGASAPKRVRPFMGHDMIWSGGKLSAVHEDGAKLATWREHVTQSFTWNVYNDVATQGTTLVETSTIAETNYTIAQGTGTVTELGNSVPYTGFLDNLSKHPVQEIINKVLKNDAKKGLDGQAWYQFNATPLKVVASGPSTVGTSTISVTVTTNGTATLTNSVNFTNLHVKSIVDAMKERNIPPYMGDEYFAIAWPTTFRPMKNSLEGVYQYRDEGFQMIYNGEIGKYEGVRFIEQTNVPHGIYNSGNYVTSASFTPWVNGLSDWIFFFGKTLPHASATMH
jgi:N4-gp56 family major capsid protein